MTETATEVKHYLEVNRGRYQQSSSAALLLALPRTRGRHAAPTRRPRKAGGRTGAGSLSALARRGPPPRGDLGRDAASGTLVSRSTYQAGWRPPESDRGARTPTARARLKHPGLRNGPAGPAARTRRNLQRSPKPLRLPSLPSRYLLSGLRRTCSGLRAHITRPPDTFRHWRQARSSRRRRDRLSLRLPPPETLPGSAPETASASGGASERKRCAHAGLAFRAGRQKSAPL